MIQKPQNLGLFNPQYLTKNLRYEVEVLDMIRGPKEHFGCFKWVCSGMSEHAQSDNK